MKFKKEFPKRCGYYWVINKDFPTPFPAYVWEDVAYPFEKHMSAPCSPIVIWTTDEHREYRFGDELEKPIVD